MCTCLTVFARIMSEMNKKESVRGACVARGRVVCGVGGKVRFIASRITRNEPRRVAAVAVTMI